MRKKNCVACMRQTVNLCGQPTRNRLFASMYRKTGIGFLAACVSAQKRGFATCEIFLLATLDALKKSKLVVFVKELI